MNALRTAILCLAFAVLSGGLTLLPADVWLGIPAAWNGALRALSLAGLIGFAVAFMVALDRGSLVKS